MTPQQSFEKIKKEILKILKEYDQESREEMLTNIELEFDKPSASQIFRTSSHKSIRPNTGDKLRLITGSLIDSYNPRDKNSASEVKFTNSTYVATYQSNLPYASVHERGYKHIPKRPYLEPATLEYEKTDSERLERIAQKLAKIFN